MTYVGCSISERYVNPLFEVFDGGDFILSSYRDIERSETEMRIYFENPEDADDAARRLGEALAVVGGEAPIERGEIADEDWRYAYRRHFKTERVSERIFTVPEWEWDEREKLKVKSEGVKSEGAIFLKLDPGMAFGTGKHETTKACLQFIDRLAGRAVCPKPPAESFLDMGCGSGILSIAAAKLGFKEVEGFDVDQEAVDASIENAAKNGVEVKYRKFALGRGGHAGRVTLPMCKYDVVAANILGPLLIRFADEIVGYCKDKLIISGILTTLYPEVLAAYEARGFKELERKTIGEWTTGLLTTS